MYVAFFLDRISICRVGTAPRVSGQNGCQVYLFWIGIGIVRIAKVYRGTSGRADCVLQAVAYDGHKIRIASEVVARRPVVSDRSIAPRSTIVVTIFVSFIVLVIFVSVSCVAISFVAV